jgi:hypothetical protein
MTEAKHQLVGALSNTSTTQKLPINKKVQKKVQIVMGDAI